MSILVAIFGAWLFVGIVSAFATYDNNDGTIAAGAPIFFGIAGLLGLLVIGCMYLGTWLL